MCHDNAKIKLEANKDCCALQKPSKNAALGKQMANRFNHKTYTSIFMILERGSNKANHENHIYDKKIYNNQPVKGTLDMMSDGTYHLEGMRRIMGEVI